MGLYLGKQSIIAINEKVATKQWVTDQRYLTNSNLSDYITKQADLISFIKTNSADKDIVGVSQNEYEYLKVNNNLKQNTLYVITDDNE